MFSPEAAIPVSVETTVNLLVGGKVVRTTTGPNSETLDWTGWDVRDLTGQTARIQIVDNNNGGWGHILADQFTFADQPALSATQRAHWLDYGRDFYAGVTFNNAPNNKRIMIAWMNNWQYGGNIPTDPWRSAMSLPRSSPWPKPRAISNCAPPPCPSSKPLRKPRPVHPSAARLQPGTTTLDSSRASGDTLETKPDSGPATPTIRPQRPRRQR